MSFKLNPLNCTDSYKLGHKDMYAENTQVIYSNMTPRNDSHFKKSLGEVSAPYYNGKVVFIGLQGCVKNMVEVWNEEFFSQDVDKVCADYLNRISAFSGGTTLTDSHIRELHAYGKLPLAIYALPEGSLVPMKVPMFVVHNSNTAFFWLTNYLETWFSTEVWKTCTTATVAHVFRNILKDFAKKTGSPIEFINWQGHDFSQRGMSGLMDSAKNGIGHLASFTGTDTLSAVDYAEYAYDGKSTFVGGSVPASEHSVMTLEGINGEQALFKRLITEVCPTGVVSLVADGFDYWQVLTAFLPELKNDIMSRKQDLLGLAKVVIRPDSGDPVKIVAGLKYVTITNLFDCDQHDELLQYDTECIYYKDAYYAFDYSNFNQIDLREEIPAHVVKGSVEVLWEIFGGTITEKGFKLLDSHIGLIYGDSITPERALEIMTRLHDKGFASGNVVFGVGSYAYQYCTRDSFGFAMKATFAMVNDQPREIFKSPKTDTTGKKSAKGLLQVKEIDGNLVLKDQATPEEAFNESLLEKLFVDGEFFRFQGLADIRLRLDPDFKL
jgi:nicotinamide phosphoribosyltransferase